MSDQTTLQVTKNNAGYMLAMEAALLSSGAEKFELEDIDEAGEHSHVLIMPDTSIVLFCWSDDPYAAESVRVFRPKENQTTSPAIQTIKELDLLFVSPKLRWSDFPNHVKLVKRLIELSEGYPPLRARRQVKYKKGLTPVWHDVDWLKKAGEELSDRGL